MKRSTGEKAWAALGLVIVVYEIVAPPNELLSEVVDRFLIKHPVVTRIVVAGIALHLLNMIPDRFDPLHQTAIIVRGERTRDTLVLLKTTDPHDPSLETHVRKALQEEVTQHPEARGYRSYRITKRVGIHRNRISQRLVRRSNVRVVGELVD